jgi:Lrp/AsnC family transcriptional regulator for asnA, asnC and gidA
MEVLGMKIDKTVLNILRSLREGRKSPNKIAEELSLSENTVRSRINAMQTAGVLKVVGLANPYALPGHQLAFICLKVKPADVLKMAEELSNQPGVVSACVVTGRFDIILEVLLSEEFTLLEFIKRGEGHMGEILSAETFMVWSTFNKMVPYTL